LSHVATLQYNTANICQNLALTVKTFFIVSTLKSFINKEYMTVFMFSLLGVQ